MELHQEVAGITTRMELIELINKLRADFIEHPDTWENPNIDSFLEAMSAWLRDIDGYYKNRGETFSETPNWRTIGELLLAAKIYE